MEQKETSMRFKMSQKELETTMETLDKIDRYSVYEKTLNEYDPKYEEIDLQIVKIMQKCELIAINLKEQVIRNAQNELEQMIKERVENKTNTMNEQAQGKMHYFIRELMREMMNNVQRQISEDKLMASRNAQKIKQEEIKE